MTGGVDMEGVTVVALAEQLMSYGYSRHSITHERGRWHASAWAERNPRLHPDAEGVGIDVTSAVEDLMWRVREHGTLREND